MGTLGHGDIGWGMGTLGHGDMGAWGPEHKHHISSTMGALGHGDMGA